MSISNKLPVAVVCWFKRTGSITLQKGPVYGRISRIEQGLFRPILDHMSYLNKVPL
jgi:hypothetical protein